MLKPIVKRLRIMALAFCTMQASASPSFHVDSLFKSSNERGHGIFTVSNQGREPLYLTGEVLRIETQNGDIKKVPLTRDNFPLWDLALNPTRAVLQVGEVRDFSVKYLCETQCDRSEDLVYQIRFYPSVEDTPNNGQQVSFLFGMAPYYVIPALKQQVDYEWDYQKDKKEIRINNTGNTFLKIELSQCHAQRAKGKSQCRSVYHVLSGHHKTISLPAFFDDTPITVKVANHDQSIEKTFTL
ncbi:hypothetical protein HUO05_25845 (plasmid) [Vibrio alginolyticus]|uniref:hypothetical protein n=1 Tax=Vibrio alginolyticus TaxID=663 RepID=UPI001593115F|nr:hypothetical protein [Vibrio alginolyticus]QKS98628.1 hypothetical protein HUO05_25845 [Vibrio alginolyticus]